MTGYGLVVIPFSFAFGVWRKPNKTIWALGPLRFVEYRGLGAWR